METALNDVVVKFTEANRNAVESALQFSRIAVRAQGLITRQQVAVLENCLAAGSRQIELTTQSRDPRELVASQAEVAAELGEKLVAVAHEAMEIQSQARDELATWLEDGLEAVKAETVAAPAAKPTRARAAKKAV